ncbi:MAG TPA: methyltransferase domain-containing protein [Acidobacteriaceae bacterium]|jgi:cytosine/adenosine deaminase-related metal-dependent hydrolase/ubiquinone/menaquinone biosynthesis C-methylase UbiE
MRAAAGAPADAIPGADSNAGAFAAWAEAYDNQPNPLIALEGRYLGCLLPRLRGLDVVDIGCGTGRWLERMAAERPRTLCGVDSSPAMLQRAAARGLAGVRLLQAEGSDLPLAASSADVILGTFMLGYVEDVDRFAREIARIAKPQATVFLSDMHPATAQQLGWKRVANPGATPIPLATFHHDPQPLIAAFERAGFAMRALIEPGFEPPERSIFEGAAHLHRMEEAEGYPAIYILELERLPSRFHTQETTLHLSGVRCALGAAESGQLAVEIEDGKIASLHSGTIKTTTTGSVLELDGYLLLPGLVNAHDHLEFALFPRLGKGGYANAKEWAEDIHARDSEVIAKHRAVPRDTRHWWGILRNLLSGVTTVCHHNPVAPLAHLGHLPCRHVEHFAWQHSPWASTPEEIRRAFTQSSNDVPFMLHAGEGVDGSSARELQALDDLGVLSERTVLIHGLGFEAAGIDLLNRREAAVVFCPSSNEFLFGKVPSGSTIRSVTHTALGSDSSLTATGDLLDEIRFTSEHCKLNAEELYTMLTRSSASMLRLTEGEGTLRPFACADLIAVKDRPGTPSEVLATLGWKDIELVFLAGEIQMASTTIYERLTPSLRQGLEPLCVEGVARWVRAPVRQLLKDTEAVLGAGDVRLNGRKVASITFDREAAA